MIEAEPEDARERLQSGEIDLALIYDFEPLRTRSTSELELAQLIDDPYDVIVPSAHRAGQAPRLRLADLAEESVDRVHRACAAAAAITERACQEAGFEPRWRSRPTRRWPRRRSWPRALA